MEIPALERQEKREKKAQVPEEEGKLKEKKTGQAKKAAIEDFGEKIGGARKDIWKERGLSVEDLALMNESEAAKYVTKENIWKKPDYRQMMADGIPPRIAFYVKEVRNALPVKAVFSHDDKTPGQIRKRQEDYIGLIRYFKENLLQIGTEDGIKAFFDRFMEEGIYIKREAFYLSRTEAGFSITNKLLRAMQVYDFHAMDRKMEKEQFTKAPEEKVPAGYRLKESEGLWCVTEERIFRKAESWQENMEALAKKVIAAALKNNVVLEYNMKSERTYPEIQREFWKLVPADAPWIAGCDAHRTSELLISREDIRIKGQRRAAVL